MKFWYRVCFVLVRVGLFFWHPVLRVQGLENLTKGAAVLCGNHSSAADPLWIILALRQPELFRIMAKSELRRAPFIGCGADGGCRRRTDHADLRDAQ